jgi:plastocyanin
MKPQPSGTDDAAHGGRRGLSPAILAVVLALTTGACAHRQPPVTAVAPGGSAVIEMKASDYKFTPNNLKATVGETLEFRIENVSGKNHNFTIKDPKGEVLKNVTLPVHQTVTVPIRLDAEGTYHFYCDIGPHATLGMKGWVTVTK